MADKASVIAFRDDGKNERALMSETDKQLEGTKSASSEFLNCLGDPTHPTKLPNGDKSYKVCGYELKVLEDTNVPVAPFVEQVKGNYLNVADEISTRPVKAGEVIHLNIVETAALISQIEYAGRFSGGSKTVILGATSSKDREEPLPILRLADPQAGSIKEGMQLVGTTKTADAPAKVADKYADTFANLFNRARRSTGDGSPKAVKQPERDYAAGFRKMFASKRIGA